VCGEVHAIDNKGRPTPLERRLVALERLDADETYLVGLHTEDANVWIVIRHALTGSRLRYALRWRHAHGPEFAAIAPSGRQLILAATDGYVALIDVAAAPIAERRAKQLARAEATWTLPHGSGRLRRRATRNG